MKVLVWCSFNIIHPVEAIWRIHHFFGQPLLAWLEILHVNEVLGLWWSLSSQTPWSMCWQRLGPFDSYSVIFLGRFWLGLYYIQFWRLRLTMRDLEESEWHSFFLHFIRLELRCIYLHKLLNCTHIPHASFADRFQILAPLASNSSELVAACPWRRGSCHLMFL